MYIIDHCIMSHLSIMTTQKSVVMCLWFTQNKLLASERDRLVKELDVVKEDGVSTKAKNSELETENRALEQALRELRDQSKLLSVFTDVTFLSSEYSSRVPRFWCWWAWGWLTWLLASTS